MKGTIKCLVFAGLAGLLLSACQAPSEPLSQPQQTGQPSESTPVPQAVTGLVATSNMYGDGDENGFYFKQYQPGHTAALYYADYKAEKVTVLCSQPNCTHDSESCTAWLQYEFNLPDVLLCGGKPVLVYRGNPYYYAQGEKAALGSVVVLQPNGADPKTLVTFSPSEELDILYSYDDQGNLYVWKSGLDTKNFAAQKHELLQIDLQTGESRAVFSVTPKPGENYFFVGVTDDAFVLKKLAVPENGEVKEPTHSILLVGTDGTLSEPMMEWEHGELNADWLGGRLFYITEKNELMVSDFSGGREKTELVLQSPVMNEMVNYERCDGDTLFINSTVDENGAALTHRVTYMVDLREGKLYPADFANYLEKGQELQLLSKNGNQYFAALSDGSLSNWDGVLGVRYGMVDVESNKAGQLVFQPFEVIQ